MINKKWIVLVLTAIFLVGCSADDDQSEKIEINETEINSDSENEDEGEQTSVETSGSEEVIHIPDETLQKGEENDSVRELQRALVQIGYPIEESGVFEDLTTWALTDLQLQKEELSVSGIFDTETRTVIEQMIQDETTVSVGNGLAEPNEPNTFTETIENPYDILALVNKSYALPANYEPTDLVVPDVLFPFEEDDPKKLLRKEAAHALEQLFAATEQAGLHLFAQSGYRSYDRQEVIFAANVEKHGEDHANTYSARAGESEHQSGLVMDVTSQEVGFDLITEFGETNEGIWLKENAHEYGFIIRYEEGKENITKYQYEPWHLRFVGEKAAKEMKASDITLEEYLGAE